MSRVITFSRVFPSYHPRSGEPTYFVEKVWKSLNVTDNLHKFLPYIEAYNDITSDTPLDELVELDDLLPKYHTIRAGNRWKVGDWFSPRVWSGRPHNSKQIQFAPDIQIKRVMDIRRDDYGIFEVCNYRDMYDKDLELLARNDGLSADDLWHWIKWPMEGQIICWNESIEY